MWLILRPQKSEEFATTSDKTNINVVYEDVNLFEFHFSVIVRYDMVDTSIALKYVELPDRIPICTWFTSAILNSNTFHFRLRLMYQLGNGVISYVHMPPRQLLHLCQTCAGTNHTKHEENKSAR